MMSWIKLYQADPDHFYLQKTFLRSIKVKTHLNMCIIYTFQQRHDGIFVEQQPQAKPKYERSKNLWIEQKTFVNRIGAWN